MKRGWMERLGFLILAALVWIPAVRWERQQSKPDHTAWQEAVMRAREEVKQGAAALQKAQEAAAQRTAPEVVGESVPDLPVNDAPKWVETRYVGFGNERDSTDAEEQGTLYLPRILLDSPDGTAVNRLIQTWYEENQRDTKESGQTDVFEADGPAHLGSHVGSRMVRCQYLGRDAVGGNFVPQCFWQCSCSGRMDV